MTADPFEISDQDILGLTPEQLPELLLRLLNIEAMVFNLRVVSLHVPGLITTPDGGEDGRIELGVDPPPNCKLTKKLTVFQCKATTLNPKACGKEVLDSSGNLKSQVEACLDAGGSYVLFLSQSLVQKNIGSRITEIRNAMRSAGRQDADTVDVRIFDANQIRDWTNRHVAAVVTVQRWRGRPQVPGLMTWDELSKHKNFIDFPFVSDDVLQKQVSDLADQLTKPKGVARLLGLSGLGKTRLALEALRSAPHEVAYVDVGGRDDNLSSSMVDWLRNGQRGLLVVDNCPLTLHENLKNAIERQDSHARLLTLYNDPSERPSHPPVKVDRLSKELITRLLQQSAPDLPSDDLQRVAEYAQGFPQMAVLLAKARGDASSNLESVVHDSFLEKLLGPNVKVGTNAYKVLSACAIFSMVGFDGNRSEEYQHVAQHLCKIDKNDFYEHVNTTLKDRQLVQQAGRYIRVEPLPLAVRLAAKWWRGCSPDLAASLITSDLPGNLAQALCDRMSQLDFLPEARELAKDLCGDQGPFGQAEVLNSDWGSRLFRSLAEVNPEAALEALERAFSHWSREQLLQVAAGRRNLVWVLEKLCFPQDFFQRAARLLMAFAAAENESWSNNATGQFKQLFQARLSGTEASPGERLVILDEVLGNSDRIYRRLAVEAMDKALETRHFTRSGGAEQMGTAPARQDWSPQTWGDLFDYWKAVLEHLTDVAAGGDELALLARTIIARHIRELIHYIADALDKSIDHIISMHGSVWPEAVESIGDAIKYEGQGMPENIRQQLECWLEKLSPPADDLPGRFHLQVSVPSWDDWEEGDDGKHIDLGARKAAALADELAGSFPAWQEHLPLLLQGEQRKGYAFGKRLGEQLTDPEPFIEQALDVLADAAPEQANMTVLGAFLGAVRSRFPDLVDRFLAKVATTPSLHRHLVDLTKLSIATRKDLDRILTLVRQGQISSSQITKHMASGKGLDHLPSEDLCSYCGSLASMDTNGAWGALGILTLYCHGDNFRWASCQDTLRGILMSPNLKMGKGLSTMDTYDWQEASEKLLKNDDHDLAAHLTRVILATSPSSRDIPGFQDSAIAIVKLLLSDHCRSVTWPLIAEALLESTSLALLSLDRLFGNSLKQDKQGSGVLFILPDDILLDWCHAHPDRAPRIIARIMPLFLHHDGEGWRLPALARTMIDRFGAQKDLLAAVSANMGTLSAWRSLVPHFKKQLQIMEELRNHPLPEVRSWVAGQSGYLNKMIANETASDQEDEWGI